MQGLTPWPPTHSPLHNQILNQPGAAMHLFLCNKMAQLHVDELTFFRIAHVWAFGTDPDLSTDVAQYKLHALIPRYVVNYLKSLQ